MKALFKSLFKLGGELPRRTSLIIGIGGMFFILLMWHLVVAFELINRGVLPGPLDVFKAFPILFNEYDLVGNTMYSLKLNMFGYLEALLITLPLGYLIGLVPFFRSFLNRYVDSSRYIPLSGMVGIFIGWFGIGDSMKVHFLAFGIIVYLLPVVIQRVMKTEKVYIQSMYTLGGNNWRMLRHVYIPAGLAKISDDIRVITAISWTYIIIAEMLNKTGGIGALLSTLRRGGHIDMMFAILFLIIVIGIIQDQLFKYLDKLIFPHKHA